MQTRWLSFAPFIFLGLWSGGYAIAKIGLLYAEPMTLLAVRYACVIAIMLVIFIVIRPPLPKTPSEWMHLAIVGFLIQTVYFALCWMAFRIGVGAGTVALIMSFQPILVAIVAPSWTKERVSWFRWVGLLLGLVGTAAVIMASSGIEPPSILGLFYCAIALLGITTGTLWEKRFGKSHHPVTANLVGYCAGLLGVVPFMLTLETMQINWTWQFSAALGYLVIGNSVIAVGLLLAMIRTGDVSSVSSLLFLVPPLAALIAWRLLDEVMPPLGWAGMAVAAVGVYIATRKTKSPVKSKSKRTLNAAITKPH